MGQTHNLTDDERDHIEALVKCFDNHGRGFGLDRLDDANQAIEKFEVELG